MAGVNGNLSWGIVPLGWSTDNVAGSFPNVYNYVNSANEPMRYQIQWANALNEDENASAADFLNGSGSLIKVVFDVQITMEYDVNWKTIGTIKKTKDIVNHKYDTGTVANIQRFTIDIAPLIRDELSYSLCPINKGTWTSNYYGGMNGGAVVQDNVLGNTISSGNYVSWFNNSNNGTYRNVRVRASWEIINGEGEIIAANSTSKLYAPQCTVINSVSQWEKDRAVIGSKYALRSNKGDADFLTRSPYVHATGLTDTKKSVRMDEAAEFLQFYVWTASWADINGSVTTGGMGGNDVGAFGFKVETFTAGDVAENTFYIRDFEANLETLNTSGGKQFLRDNGRQNCIQNVSPYYIKNTATKYSSPNGSGTPVFPYWASYSGDTITDDTTWYRVGLRRFGLDECTDPSSGNTSRKSSEYRYYVIDREDENLTYNYVRFHWLNSLGGIDSYTAKRNITEGLTINREVIERKSVDRKHYQTSANLDICISDTMRGGNLYQGGREVINVNADRTLSVYTEPLNIVTANWLEEIMLSTNVWVEMDTNATAQGNARNANLRPSTKGYIPVIITNSDVETVNQEQGLVTFNIEYTLAHKVETQRT